MESTVYFKYLCRALWGTCGISSSSRWGWQAARPLCGVFACKLGKWGALPNAVVGNKLSWLAQKNSEVLQFARGKTKECFLFLMCSLFSIFLYCFYPPYLPQMHTTSSLQVCHRPRKTIPPKNQWHSWIESYRKRQLKKSEKCKPCWKRFGKYFALNRFKIRPYLEGKKKAKPKFRLRD